MEYETAKQQCRPSASIYRTANPGRRYPKDHILPLDERVPSVEKAHKDWHVYDAREFGETEYDLRSKKL